MLNQPNQRQRNWFLFLLALAILCCPDLGVVASQVSIKPSKDSIAQAELAMATELQQAAQSQWAQWLGPLAPLALSPFFAITCLAGVAQLGGDYLPANPLLQNSAFLNNPTVFWVFAGLTLMTSLPRLTKVSKPAAQAIDLLETYAGIVTILALRFLSTSGGDSNETTVALAGASSLMVQMGLWQFSTDMLFAIAAALNILVINAVKFFIEVLVWLIPIPTIDAFLEGCNKLICGGLVALYAFSPLLATLLNLILFAACLFVFAQVSRRTRQMRSLIAEPLWAMVSRTYGTYSGQSLVVFNQQKWGRLPPFSKWILRPVKDGWEFHSAKWWLFPCMIKVCRDESELSLREGLMVNTITIAGNHPGAFTFSRRFRNQAPSLCEHLNLAQSSTSDGRIQSPVVEPEFS